MGYHLDDALEVHVADESHMVRKHDINCNFVEDGHFVRQISPVASVKQLQLVWPVQLVVNGVVAVSEQGIDRVAVELDQARKVQVDDPAQGRELKADSTA